MTAALRIEHLSKTYRNGVFAVDDISLTVEEGAFFGLLGPNGAGKSTTIGIVSSLVVKTSGKVCIFDTDIDANFAKAKSYLGIVPQEFNFNMFETPLQILIQQAGYYGVPYKIAYQRAEQHLQRLGLWDKRNGQARMLSGGMKRRLMIARALMHEPRLLILDEPTAGVDIELRRQMWDFLQKTNANGTTIILTTHYLEEAEHLCKELAIINHGRIIETGHTKMLLSKLDKAAFICDLVEPITFTPTWKEFEWHITDPKTIEISIDKSQTLNTVFQAFNAVGMQVQSLRNKTNRLEEVFVNLLSEK